MNAAEQSKRSLIKNIALTLMPATVLFAAGAASDTHLGLLIVMAEPLILALGAYILVWALIEQKALLAGAVAASMIAGAFSLHEPRVSTDPLTAGPDWLRELRGCAILAKPAKGPVRLVTWTVDGAAGLVDGVDAILDIKPDIVVLNGTDDPAIGGVIQEALNGEAKFVPGLTDRGGMLAVVRGSFQYCDGEDDEWHLELPSFESGSASVMIGFPHVADIGVIPLMMTRLDHAQGPLDWLDWSRRVIDGATVSAQAAQTIGSRKMVLVGDMQAPASSLAMAAPLRASGLNHARSEPNWPTQIQGLPFWTQHALDQVWAGPGWHVQSSRILQTSDQVRAPIVTDLVPNTKN
jgi:hypothetical protein